MWVMGELKREVKTYEVVYLCDSCHQGQMVFAKDITLTGAYSSKYLHRCDSCGSEKQLDRRYPERRSE